MKICSKCGAQFDDIYMQCTRCGDWLPPTPITPEMYNNTPYFDQPTETPEEEKSGGLSIAAFILSFFLAPVGAVLGIVALAIKCAKKGLAIASVVIGFVGTFIFLLNICIMVPQLAKYTEKTYVAADTQLCDSIKSAMTTAMMDPDICNTANNGIPTNSDWMPVRSVDEYSPFGRAVREMTGYSVSELDGQIRSSYMGGKASGLQFKVEPGCRVSVRIENSDSTGGKGKSGPHSIISR